MSDQLVPTNNSLAAYDANQSLQEWGAQQLAPPVRSPIERPLAAIRRYKWLVLILVMLSVVAGVAATRFVVPQYEVRAQIMIASDGPMENRTGPIRAGSLLPDDDWGQLLKSFTISDAVVRQLTLYLRPANPNDRWLFKDFTLASKFAPGKYELALDNTTKRWTLSPTKTKTVADSGTAADSVGRRFGFKWMLPAGAFSERGVATVKFNVAVPRETAIALSDRLEISRRQGSSFLILSFEDPDPKMAAAILNAWVNRYVDVAAELKKVKLRQYANILDQQVQTAKAVVDSAEVALSSFKVNTITEPSEGAAIAPGSQETRDPMVKAYFDKKIEYANIRSDIQLLRSLIASVNRDSVPSEALLQITSVAAGAPVAQSLRDAINAFHTTEAELATDRAIYQDEHPKIKALVATLNRLKHEDIPRDAAQLLASLREREVDDSLRIAAAGADLQQIPERTIEEERLRRRRDVASGLYSNLQNRNAEAQLAEASATPDVRVLDSAIAPLSPTTNKAWRVALMAIVCGIGGSLVLAILLDKLDGRLRYVDQATEELGLPVAGTIPRFPKGGVSTNSPEQMFQLIESFRSLRMAVLAASDAKVVVAISSPAPSEGKSLISANLAISFADAGLRTVLVDGDTRRGSLHSMFGLTQGPGLTEFLAGTAGMTQVLHATQHERLSIVACGRRQRRSPELLTSARLPELVSDLRQRFDVVIFDTPPLAAGVDAYSVSAATGSLLLVLRVGQTLRRLTAEKLRMFERLPVNILGVVLNGIQFSGAYEYYGYTPGYEAVDDPGAALPEEAQVL